MSAAAEPGGVVVVGSIVHDLSLHLPRLPLPGETVVGGQFLQAPGGKGANQAIAASRLGARVSLVAAAGEDELGRWALAELEREGVDGRLVQRPAAPTGVAVVLVDAGGENEIAVALGANLELEARGVERALLALSPRPFLLLGCLEVADAAVLAAFRVGGELGLRRVLNTAPARPVPTGLLEMAEIVICNESELQLISPAGASSLLQRHGVEAVVVTRAAAGADLLLAGREMRHLSALQISAVDSTGAGDTFCGALCAALARGMDLDSATERAVVAASLAVRSPGTRQGMPTWAEVDRALSSSA